MTTLDEAGLALAKKAFEDANNSIEQCDGCHGAGRHPDESMCGTCGGNGWVAPDGWDPMASALTAYLSARPAPPHEAVTVEWADESMAQHWIDRYAAGLDGEPQMDRILDCVRTKPLFSAPPHADDVREGGEAAAFAAGIEAAARWHDIEGAAEGLLAVNAAHEGDDSRRLMHELGQMKHKDYAASIRLLSALSTSEARE